MSYMKAGRAQRWTARIFRWEQLLENSGHFKFLDWEDFRDEFCKYFTPTHADSVATNQLESTAYFQAKRSLDEYMDEFQDLIDEAGYTDPKTTVVKFRRGLNPQIQNAVATMAAGRPSDRDLSAWYSAARTVDQNMAANEAFLSAQQAPAAAAAGPSVTPIRPPAPLLLQRRTHSVPISEKPVDVHTLTVDELQEILKDRQAELNTASPAIPMPAPVDKPEPVQKRQANCTPSLPNSNRFSILSMHDAARVDESDEAVCVVQPVKDSPAEGKSCPRWERHLPATLVIAALEKKETLLPGP
jgi:Retrotransposon gag protein